MEQQRQKETSVDVLIIGSGPVGATFARVIADQSPEATILMIDAGPRLTQRPGLHVKNIPNLQEQKEAQIRSQGPTQFEYETPPMPERAGAMAAKGHKRISLLSRPGTHLINPNDADIEKSDMPATAAATNVGGAGVHWTCACPRPSNTERIPFIPYDEWDRVCTHAEELLAVTTKAYPETVEGFAIQQVLGELFNPILPDDLKVRPMPLAVQPQADGTLYWSGPEVILGHLLEMLDEADGRFHLRSETICRQLIVAEDRIIGAEIEHLPSGKRERMSAQYIAVAADSLRTPQLLWASGIRPRALGHYLNDHCFSFTPVVLSDSVIERARQTLQADGRMLLGKRLEDEVTIGIYHVPFHAPEHPYHAQVMHLDISPFAIDTTEMRGHAKHIVGLGWVFAKQIRFEDYVEFSDSETDHFGMPKMTFHYALTEADVAAKEAASHEQKRVALAFGASPAEVQTLTMPNGTSLHYQGTMRMGEQDDGTSVCDSYSQVWGVHNLYVGGNGVIPTATACNPTLTSVALAVRAAEKIAAGLLNEK